MAGPGAAGVYSEPESEPEPMYYPDAGSAQGMCRIFLVAGFWSLSQTIFRKFELELSHDVLLGARVAARAIAIFSVQHRFLSSQQLSTLLIIQSAT